MSAMCLHTYDIKVEFWMVLIMLNFGWLKSFSWNSIIWYNLLSSAKSLEILRCSATVRNNCNFYCQGNCYNRKKSFRLLINWVGNKLLNPKTNESHYWYSSYLNLLIHVPCEIMVWLPTSLSPTINFRFSYLNCSLNDGHLVRLENRKINVFKVLAELSHLTYPVSPLYTGYQHVMKILIIICHSAMTECNPTH